jgi:3-deoxy-manno-octulosonate cytidylyltransferase (CMP-KDO synthetase)
MPVLVVIPARLGSTRLPRKPLQPLGGVPLIVRVAERVQGHGLADRMVIATDADEVAAVVRQAGFEVVLTRAEHRTGTERVFEVASREEFAGYDRLLNVQGDEPFVTLAAMRGALAQLERGFDLGTAAIPVEAPEARYPARVKVVTDLAGRALYFSRSLIPHGGLAENRRADAPQYWQHLGVYAYRAEALARVARSAPTPLELAERLEQLRALELGLSIGVELLDEPARPSVDTPGDLEEAEEYWNLTTEVPQ